MIKASGRHILVMTLEECEQLKRRIEGGDNFTACARKYSLCPSAKKGGELGTIKPGQLIRELDAALFNGEVGRLIGPVESEFGYHLIEITHRS